MVDTKNSNEIEDDTMLGKKLNSNVCPLSDNYFTKCPVMRTYYYLIEEFFASWSWSG